MEWFNLNWFLIMISTVQQMQLRIGEKHGSLWPHFACETKMCNERRQVHHAFRAWKSRFDTARTKRIEN